MPPGWKHYRVVCKRAPLPRRLQAICELELADLLSGHRAPARVRPRLTAFAVALQMQLICDDRKIQSVGHSTLDRPALIQGESGGLREEEAMREAIRRRSYPGLWSTERMRGA